MRIKEGVHYRVMPNPGEYNVDEGAWDVYLGLEYEGIRGRYWDIYHDVTHDHIRYKFDTVVCPTHLRNLNREQKLHFDERVWRVLMDIMRINGEEGRQVFHDQNGNRV